MPYFEINFIVLLVLFGAFQGLILSFVLVFTPRLRKASNLFLALLLFNFAILNISSGLEFLPISDNHEFINYLPTFWVTLIPPAVYFFITYLIVPNYKWTKKDSLCFLPFAIEISHRVYRFFYYMLVGPYSETENNWFYFLSNVYESFAVVATIAILIYGIKRLRTYEKKLYENYAEVEDKSLSWLKTTLMTGIVISSLWMIVTATDFSPKYFHDGLAISVLLLLSFLIYWIGYSMIIRQNLLNTPIFAINEILEERTASTNELSSKTNEHYERLIKIVEVDEIYKNPNLNMTMLAEKLDLSNGYVSQIINQKEKQNFFDFINSYRLKEVKKNMADPKFDHYTILGIAQEAGFKSKSTFNTVFKKFTGQTPSNYKKSL